MEYKGNNFSLFLLPMKKGFTLVEIVVVVIVIGIMLSMIPFRMQNLQSHTRFSLMTNEREDFRQKTSTRMRQWSLHPVAIVSLSNSWAVSVFTGGSGAQITEQMSFLDGVTVNIPVGSGQWNLKTYALWCEGNNTWFQISRGRMRACYVVDTASCKLIHFSCNRQ